MRKKTSIPKNKATFRLLLLLFFVIMKFSYGLAEDIRQDKILINGTVIDATTNDPLPGVSVMIKGTSTGTVTDMDGNYSIQAIPGQTLIFNFIGYLSEEVVTGNQTEIMIRLSPDVIGLDEVIVTGYGVQKKSDLTGAIASVSSDDLSKTPVTGLDQALQGMAAGVSIIPISGRPGGTVNIQIRGVASINGTNPLIILDGVSQGTDPAVLSRINPEDVESIEVLKDASAAAIYGASGGNGVILVTTKSGKAGDLKVSYNAYVGEENVIRKLDLMNTQQWIELVDETSTSIHPFSTRLDTFKTYDWQDIIFQQAITQNHDLALSGGNEKSKYLFSTSFSKDEGIIKNTANQRLTMRLNGSHKINKYLTFEERISYLNTATNGFADWEYTGYYQNPVMPALQMIPYQPAYDKNGIWTIPYGGVVNPMASIDMKDNTMKTTRLEGNFSLILTPLKGLSYTCRFTDGQSFGDNKEFLDVYWASPTNLRTGNELVQSMNKGLSWNLQNIVTYSNTFLNDHNLTLMAGQEAGRWWGYDIRGTRADMPSSLPNLLYFSMSVNDTLAKQIIEGGGYEGRNYRYFGRLNYDYKSKYLLTINISRDYASNFGPLNRAGTFPSFSVGWKFTEEEFMKNFSFINFGKIRIGWGQTGANSKDGFPYLTTVVTPDGYMYAVNGRVASVGAAPDQIANPSLKWEAVNMTNFGLDLNMFNNKLTLTAEYFIKVNDGMIMAQQIPYLTGSYNMTMPQVNIGSIQNKGFDITLGHKNNLGDFKYSLDLNVGIVRNTVLSLATDSLKKGGVHNVSPITLTREGMAVSEFWGFETDGLFRESDPTTEVDGKTVITNQPYSTNSAGDIIYMQKNAQPGDFRFKDQDGDGKLTDADKVSLGSPLPKFTFGLNINLSYKIFDLSAFFTGSYGNKVFNGTKQYLYYSQGYGNRLAAFADRYKDEVVKDGIVVVQANKDTDIPRFDADNYTRTSDFYIEDGSYIRLRSIQLGITLPASITNKVGIEKFRIYLGAKNLFTLTKYSAFDPVVSGGSTNGADGTMIQGIDIGAYPSTRMFLAGINLEF
jgi:TonB-dependent starch-binding outer membrane protein SusC